MDWIDIAQDRDKSAGACECSNETSASTNPGNLKSSVRGAAKCCTVLTVTGAQP